MYKNEATSYKNKSDAAFKEANSLKNTLKNNDGLSRNKIRQLKEDIKEFEREKDIYLVKMKMIIPLRDQLEFCFGLTSRAKGGWT